LGESDDTRNQSAYIQAAHPWGEAVLAPLYDAFPFSDDLPLYVELAEAAAREGGQVLEVACGSGRVLVALARAGCRITGVDVSPHMLALAREKLSSAGPDVAARARLVQADMRSFELGGLFDMAFIAVKSFSYLVSREDQQRALDNIATHLRPGGLFALDLMNPSPSWLLQPPGSLRQDLAQFVPGSGVTVVRTETAVSTDLAAQVRVIRSAYEVVESDGSIHKYFVEWPYRYIYRFEAEHLLERAGFQIEAVYGGYRREAFTSDSKTMFFIGRSTG
jgi:SAM-dependent methyltransferase